MQGPSPSLSQYPTSSFGYVPPTYAGGQQPYARVPGPAALNAPPQLPQSGAPASGVAGVSMAPVAHISPPASPGGPHQLPSLPQVPLPQGFPNPFQLQNLTQQQPPAPAWPGAAPAAPPGQAPGQAPGVVTVTGPAGYLPGLGYFGNQPAPGHPPIPGPAAGSPPAPVQEAAGYLAAAAPYQAQPAAPPPTAFPVLPGAIPQPQVQAVPQAVPQGMPQPAPAQPQAPANPFWLQLAWQLIQTPPVRSALGDRFQQLTEGEDRLRFLSTAAACLTGPDLQNAFKAMTAGSLDQSRFITLFADHLVRALGQ